MLKKTRKILGLAVEDRSILAAEANVGIDSMEIMRAAEFRFPEPISWDTPEKLGTAFAAFLRQHGFAAHAVRIGLPAKWLLVKEKTFPEADTPTLAGMIRLAIEQSFAIEPEKLLFDYFLAHPPTLADTANGNRSQPGAVAQHGGIRVFMAALLRDRKEVIMRVAQAAGRQVKSMTATALSLADTLEPAVNHCLILLVRPERMELIWRDHGRVRKLHHWPVNIDQASDDASRKVGQWQKEMVNQIKIALADRVEEWLDRLFLCNGTRLGDEELRLMAEKAFGMPVALVDRLAPAEAAEIDPSSQFEGAKIDGLRKNELLALLHPGSKDSRASLDFLHSRLEPRRQNYWTQSRVRLAAGLAALFLMVAVPLTIWMMEQGRLAKLREQVAMQAELRQEAEVFWQRYSMWLDWTEKRPRLLEALRELSLAIPTEQPIWLSRLAIGENMQITLAGKSDGEAAILETLDRLRRNPRFQQVKTLYLREAGAETTFSIAFLLVERTKGIADE